MKDRVNKTLTYKRALIIPDEVPYDLGLALMSALKQKPKASDRFEPTQNDQEMRCWFNNRIIEGDVCFATLLACTAGKHAHLVAMDHDTEEMDVNQLAPPDMGDGRRREFLDSIGFISVNKHHVVLAQSTTLRSRAFERYINWILHDGKVLDQNQRVLLVDHPKPDVRAKLSEAPVRAIRIGDELVDSVFDAEEVFLKNSFTLRGAVESLLDRLGLFEDKRDKLADALTGSSLRMELVITSKGKKVPSNAGQKFLDSVAEALRHAEEEDFTVRLRNGAKLTAKDLRISKSVWIKSIGGNPDPRELFVRMHEWLRELLTQETIDP